MFNSDSGPLIEHIPWFTSANALIAADRGSLPTLKNNLTTLTNALCHSLVALKKEGRQERFGATRPSCNHRTATFTIPENISRLKTDAEIYGNALRIRKLFLILAFPC